MLVLYRADEPGIFDSKPGISGGAVDQWHRWPFFRIRKLNGTIPDGYQHRDYRPHEITGLESGDYWLAEEIALDYYTRAEPVSITYELDQGIYIGGFRNQEVKGKLKIRKEGNMGNYWQAQYSSYQVFQQPEWSGWSLWNCLFRNRGAYRSRYRQSQYGQKQVQLGPVQNRQSLTETPVLERK